MLTGADIAAIVASITAMLTSIAVAIISNREAKKEMKSSSEQVKHDTVEALKLALQQARHESDLSDEKIHGELEVIKSEVSTLREEVQKHNSVIERTFKLEETARHQGERINENSKRIDMILQNK